MDNSLDNDKRDEPGFGVVLDQHYTDTLLRTVLNPKINARDLFLRTRRPLSKKDILVTLLLFGKAYLSKPYWYRHYESNQLERLKRDGLIEWLPAEYDFQAFLRIGEICENAFNLDTIARSPQVYSYDTVQDTITEEAIADTQKNAIENYMRMSELEFDTSYQVRRLLYLEPVIRANLRHLRYEHVNYQKYFEWWTPELQIVGPLFYSKEDVRQLRQAEVEQSEIEGQLDEYRDISMELLSNNDEALFKYLQQFSYTATLLEELNDTQLHSLLFQLKNQSAVFHSSISSCAAEAFAGDFGYPIKSATSWKSPDYPKYSGQEEYSLIRIQFDELRYPVIEKIEDVMRLREDKHLETYRKVILEYSARLRSEIEEERPKVISEFRKDLRNAVQDLQQLGTWGRFENVIFYISIPLALVGVLAGVPLSDMLIIPATLFTKIVAKQRRNKLDWLLFGRNPQA